jgi:hypothetical protein
MGLSTSVLYELIVLANLALLAVAAGIVVGLLRWLLSGWSSIWLKTIAVHTVNLVVALFIVPDIIDFFPSLWLAGLTHGSIIDFCLSLMIADGARVWAKTQPKLVRSVRGFLPLILFFTVSGLAVLIARIDVAPGAKAAFEKAALTGTAR